MSQNTSPRTDASICLKHDKYPMYTTIYANNPVMIAEPLFPSLSAVFSAFKFFDFDNSFFKLALASSGAVSLSNSETTTKEPSPVAQSIRAFSIWGIRYLWKSSGWDETTIYIWLQSIFPSIQSICDKEGTLLLILLTLKFLFLTIEEAILHQELEHTV